MDEDDLTEVCNQFWTSVTSISASREVNVLAARPLLGKYQSLARNGGVNMARVYNVCGWDVGGQGSRIGEMMEKKIDEL